jgi:hypothetical protein
MSEPTSPPAVRRVLSGTALTLMLAGAASAAAPPAKPAKPAAAKPAPQTMAFQPKTYVDGAILQVILGERALFRLDSGEKPVLDNVEKGQLAAAHPDGAVNETFAPPPDGLIAAALDGSAEKRATSLKIWNGTSQPIEYRAIVLVMKQGQTLQAMPVPTCPVAPGHVRLETWPAPIVAVGLSRFKPATKAALIQPACNRGK